MNRDEHSGDNDVDREKDKHVVNFWKVMRGHKFLMTTNAIKPRLSQSSLVLR